MKTSHKYNWKPDLPDFRDHLFQITAPEISKVLPPIVNLQQQCSPIVNQGKIGSCTGNALAASLEFLELRELKIGKGTQVFDLKDFEALSRLFIYYNERVSEQTTGQDSGARLRDGVKTLIQRGVCREKIWQYTDSNVLEKPSPKAYDEALRHKISQYLKIPNLNQGKICLADGYPFVFGFTVYESFESTKVAETGIVPLPEPDERILGGHAVMAVGYNNHSQSLLVRNSWGPLWGQNGYFQMPFEYISTLKLAQDFWTIRL